MATKPIIDRDRYGTARAIEKSGTHYEVFGRWRTDGQLSHIGTVAAPNMELAKARAQMVYSERPWVELAVVPSADFENLLAHKNQAMIGFA